MPGGFYYQGPEELEVGEVDGSKMARVHEILRGIEIEKAEHGGWNCQSWALDGLERLREEGFVYSYLGQEEVKNWLKET